MKLLEYRLRPKRDYLMVAPWQELYELTKYWKAELAFYEEELQFLDNLVTLYEGPAREAPELRRLLDDTRLQLRTLMNQADTHLSHLGKVVRDADNSEDELFREEHDVLEDNIHAFTGTFRQLKQKLFKTVERVIPRPAANTKPTK